MAVRPRIAATLALIAAAIVFTACGGGIRSVAVITSEPTGATVFWRGQERGDTPIEIPFIWYWYYDIKIEKPGYDAIEVMEPLRSKPWFVFPLDLFWETMPFIMHDTRTLHYVLKPTPPKDNAPTGK